MGITFAARGEAEITGSIENGTKRNIDLEIDDGKKIKELDDRNFYNLCWVKYKKELESGDYYYIKLEYYKNKYMDKTYYNNKTLNIWGVYSWEINKRLTNKYEVNFKDKNYYIEDYEYKSYLGAKLKCEFDYELNDRHEYSAYIQRYWEDNKTTDDRDNVSDTLSVTWDYEVNSKTELTTNIKLWQEEHPWESSSTNKYEKTMSVGFEYEL